MKGLNNKRIQRASNGLAFLALFPILAAALFLVNDFARALVLQQKLRQVADSCALAAAGALDEGSMIKAGSDFEIYEPWVNSRMSNVKDLSTIGTKNPNWMNINACQARINNSDRTVEVSVSGSVTNAFASGIGAPGGFSTKAIAKARAAIGISSDNW